ncbi:MAG: hypothetical protein C4K47_04135 [Candidatus Thorarchaeota archaeon]|nr:MAG: hypothetical protein C4K47_04135 [Candidatus Thorarchaeota archaeon]
MQSARPFVRDGKFLVSKVHASSDLRASIKKAVDLIGGFDKAIVPGDTVTIKPNLNTADPYPASSDASFVEALGRNILDAGADKIQIAESSMVTASTREASSRVGLTEVAERLGADIVFLEEQPYTKVRIADGKFLKETHIGKPLLDIGTLVLAPCLKTHKYARFTASMKLLVGWMNRQDRVKMHMSHLEEKVVELASFFHPVLIVMDARKVFVTGGPASGRVEEPGIILASGDMVSIDVQGVRILQTFNADNKLNMDVWDLPQVRRAKELKIGASSDDDIDVIEEH